MTSMLADMDDVLLGRPEFDQTPFTDHVLEMTGSVDGTYTVTINQSPFAHVAVAESETQIRDALVTLIQAGSEPVTASASKTNRIKVKGDPGVSYELSVSSSGSPITDTQPMFEAAIAQAVCILSPTRALECYSEATALIVAHCWWTSPSGKAASGIAGFEAGPTTAEADGPASRSFGAVAAFNASDAGWDSSPYGRKYLTLRKRWRGRSATILANSRRPQTP